MYIEVLYTVNGGEKMYNIDYIYMLSEASFSSLFSVYLASVLPL